MDTTITMRGDVLLADAVVVQGDSIVRAGSGESGAGWMDFTGRVDADTVGNTLVLSAGGDRTGLRSPNQRDAGDIYFRAEVGAELPLSGLRIEDAIDVVFEQKVTVNGDLVINATGTVRFESTVHIVGGQLIINGADEVVFEAGVELSQGSAIGHLPGLVFDDVYRVLFVGAAVPALGEQPVAGGNLMISGGGHMEGVAVPATGGQQLEALRLSITGAVPVLLSAIDADRAIDLGGITVHATDVGRLSVVDTVVAKGGRGLDIALLASQGDVSGELRVLRNMSAELGSITLQSSGRLTLVSGADVTAQAGDLHLSAATQLSMGANSRLQASAGSLRLSAGDGMTLGTLVAQDAVSLVTAAGDVAVATGTGAGLQPTVTAQRLRIETGGSVGSATSLMVLDVDTLSVRTTPEVAASGVWLRTVDAVVLDGVAVSVRRADGQGGFSTTTDAAFASMELAGGLHLVAGEGQGASVTVRQALSVAGDIEVQAQGPVVFERTLDLQGSLHIDSRQAQDGAVRFGQAVTVGQGAEILAQGGVQFDASLAVASGGLRIETPQALTADLRFAGSAEVAGDVFLQAQGDVWFHSTLQVGAGGLLTVAGANELRFVGGINLNGASGLLFQDTYRVGFEQAVVPALGGDPAAGGNLLITGGGRIEGRSVASGASPLQVLRLELMGDQPVTVRAIDALRDINLGGIGLIAHDVGVLTVRDGVSAFGERGIQIASQGEGAELLLMRSLNSEAGAISLESSGNIELADRVAVQTRAGGTINIDASAGRVLMTQHNLIVAADSNLRMRTSGPIDAGTLAADKVWLVTDSTLAPLTGGGLGVTANELRLDVQGALGTAINPLQLAVQRISITTRGQDSHLFLSNQGSITVGYVDAAVVRPDEQGGIQTIRSDSTTGVQSTGHVVVSAGGTIAIETQAALVAQGHLLLQAAGVGADVVLDGAVASTGGNISIHADGSIWQNTHLLAQGATGTLDLVAGGSITMGAGATTTGQGGDLRYAAGSHMVLQRIDAGTGHVALVAGENGSITAAATDGAVHVSAAMLALQAGAAIGSQAGALAIQVGTLAAQAGAGGIFLSTSGGLNIGDVSNRVSRVGLDAQTEQIDSALAQVVADQGGAVALYAVGDIQLGHVQGGAVTLVSSEGAIVGAPGAATHLVASSLHLQAAGAVGERGNSLITDVGVLSASSRTASLFLAEANDLVLGDMRAAGHIDLSAGGSLAMADASRVQAFSIGLTASGMALGEIKAQGEVRLDGRSGEIRSQLQAAQTNITADSLAITGFGVPTDSSSIALRAQVARVQLNTGEAEQVGSGSLRDRQMVLVLQSASQVLHQQVVVDGREFQRIDSGNGQVIWSIQPLPAPVAPQVPGSLPPIGYDEAKALLQLERGRRSAEIAELSKPNALITMMLEQEEDSDALKEAFLLEGSMGDGQASKDMFDFDLWVEELML